MLLAIDVGNTNTVFALFDQDYALVGQWRLATNPNRTSDEYGFWLRQLFAIDCAKYLPIQGVILATVVPQTQYELVRCCKRYFDISPVLVKSTLKQLDISIDVDHPSEVGADRLVNAVEAWKRYQSGVVILDFGTATTFDVVDKTGTYLGGVIAPGINLSLLALQQAAAKLPSVRIRKTSDIIGKNTVSAMESGIYFGYIGMIEGVLTRICAERDDIEHVVATGGLASLYAEDIPAINETIPDLTIYGLATLYRKNKDK